MLTALGENEGILKETARANVFLDLLSGTPRVRLAPGAPKASRMLFQPGGFFLCAGHGTILAGESPVTGGYRQV